MPKMPTALIEGEISRMNAKPGEFESHASWQLRDRVRTIGKLEKRNYTAEGIKARRPNVTGTVVDLSNSHGLCFKVIHDDGSYAYYDPDELEDPLKP